MASGVEGAGPYSLIKWLRQEITHAKYELGLIDSGMRRRLGRKHLQEIIKENRQKIKEILAEEKSKKNK